MCPECDYNEVGLLGRLGRLYHLRCRGCGWTFSIPVDELELGDPEDVN